LQLVVVLGMGQVLQIWGTNGASKEPPAGFDVFIEVCYAVTQHPRYGAPPPSTSNIWPHTAFDLLGCAPLTSYPLFFFLFFRDTASRPSFCDTQPLHLSPLFLLLALLILPHSPVVSGMMVPVWLAMYRHEFSKHHPALCAARVPLLEKLLLL